MAPCATGPSPRFIIHPDSAPVGTFLNSPSPLTGFSSGLNSPLFLEATPDPAGPGVPPLVFDGHGFRRQSPSPTFPPS